MIVNLSDPKTSKTYNIKNKDSLFVGSKMGDIVSLDQIGIKGKGVITGGSTKEGFPIVPFLNVNNNKKILLSEGTGFKARFKGERRRKTVHGRIVGERVSQVNIKITDIDKSVNLEELFGKKEEEKKE